MIRSLASKAEDVVRHISKGRQADPNLSGDLISFSKHHLKIRGSQLQLPPGGVTPRWHWRGIPGTNKNETAYQRLILVGDGNGPGDDPYYFFDLPYASVIDHTKAKGHIYCSYDSEAAASLEFWRKFLISESRLRLLYGS
jgi:hypothetical protein